MINLGRHFSIDQATAIYRDSLTVQVPVYHTADNAFLTAPTFEEFITRNRIILHEEVVR